ncbi:MULTISPECIES: TetR/AcrR family transcriptional regulator [Paenibacillus]|jgi:AcrR family transcriptional regulator|uniref:TetR/AcrR family transcriptional regulator n=1 Tax=Paenibacillus TaxID=44249 RepID=UPI0004F635C2|nr:MULTISPECIES: TetR/AcrR family transcriptional regulator [unclassified Paenibacillus]AIQ27716.1 TetR family transcriptional regulator [Paenibacillus sp. FSL P4-0081]OMF22981.1 TetR family transcriptional regulator [Paenibacillus sp. FSL H8-0259]
MGEIEDKVRTPQQERSIRTKEAIIRAAMKLFSDKGFHQTNTKEIAAAAGVSTGSFYSYFIDKRAVFIDVLHMYGDDLLARIDASMSEINFETIGRSELILHLIDTLLLSHKAFIGYHKDLSIMYHSDEVIKQLMDAQYETGRLRTLKYLQMGQDELKTEDVEAASVIVFEAVSAIVDVISFSPQRIAVDRLKSELVNMLVQYLYK